MSLFVKKALFMVPKSKSFPTGIIARFSSATGDIGVTVNDKTGVATVKLQRTPVNSLNTGFLKNIESTLNSLEKEKARGLILTSGLPKIFTAGLDILELYNCTPESLTAFWTQLQSTWLRLHATSFPSVALINGHAPGAGCQLAMSCEYRIMLGPKYTIGLNETKMGIIAPFWFVDTMVDTLGPRQAELALTSGKLFTSSEALKVGLIDEEAGSEEEGIAKAEAFLSLYATIPGTARKLTKLMIREKTISNLMKNKEKDLKTVIELITSPQVQKGLGLYLQSLKKK
uniref:Enoyl-CoA delta isomerase 1, mitochondrial n=1 Tax=Cacopsylla melanoneura TaxID=428564 RepID=A0A8D8RJU9_9HEMI